MHKGRDLTARSTGPKGLISSVTSSLAQPLLSTPPAHQTRWYASFSKNNREFLGILSSYDFRVRKIGSLQQFSFFSSCQKAIPQVLTRINFTQSGFCLSDYYKQNATVQCADALLMVFPESFPQFYISDSFWFNLEAKVNFFPWWSCILK